MATSEGCSMCEKGAGAYFCIGCKKHFCKKDFHNHRETLNNELYGYIEDRNTLQEKISKPNQQKNICSPLLLQIDEWQQQTIEKVKQAAEQARQQVMQILNSKGTEITSEFEKLSQELIQLKETEDFTEQDLKRLKQTINRLNEDLKQLAQAPTIELHREESQKIAWNCLIYVEDKTNYPAKQQGQQRVMGELISEHENKLYKENTV
jgi:vacuolar-type H+-ATPase subunit I/STV1